MDHINDEQSRADGLASASGRNPNNLAGGSECSRRLTHEEFDRYSRQMIVPGMGKEGNISLSGFINLHLFCLWTDVDRQASCD